MQPGEVVTVRFTPGPDTLVFPFDFTVQYRITSSVAGIASELISVTRPGGGDPAWVYERQFTATGAGNLTIQFFYLTGITTLSWAVTCQPAQGTLQLVKRTTGGDGTFAFTSAELSNPSLTTVSGMARTAATSVAPGTYTITEAAPAGWDLTSIACAGGATAAAVDLARRTVSVPVASNENVICTFDNRAQPIERTGSLRLVKRTTGGDGSFEFSSTSTALGNPSLTTTSGMASTDAATVSPGSYALTEARTEGWNLSSIECAGNASAAAVNLVARSVTVPVGADEAVVCTFTNTEVKKRTETIIRNFLKRRAGRIVNSGPSASRLANRLSQDEPRRGSLKDEPPTGEGSLKDEPMTLGGPRDGESEKPGSTNAGFIVGGEATGDASNLSGSASLAAMAGPGRSGEAARFDIWAEGTFEHIDFDDAQSSGHFGMLTVGADYKLMPWLLVGVMSQYDSMQEKSAALGYLVEGNGWMAGPYSAMRLSDNLVLDGRYLYGTSSNDISPFLTYIDTFETDRWLAAMRLTGQWSRGAWTFTPSAEVVKFSETSEAYVDSNGIGIDSQSVDIGRAIFGPQVSYTFTARDGTQVSPHAALKALWDFDSSATASLSTPGMALDSSEWQARVEAGLSLQSPGGTSLDIDGALDGLGSGDADAMSVKGTIRLPLN